MKTQLIKLLSVIIITLFCSADIFAQATNKPNRDGIQFSPRWIDNLVFLNHFDHELPPEKQALYKWAETHLADETDKGFASLADYYGLQNHCKEHNIKLLGGPMLGNVTTNSVNVWVRTVKPGKVEVIVNGGEKELKFGPAESTTDSELSAVIPVSGLEPATKYTYSILVDGEKIETPFETTVKTLSDDKADNTRILFGSCFHRWGLGNEKQSRAMIDRNPDAFLAIGDIAAQDRNNSMGWHSLDYLARDLYPAWQKLVSKIPVYAGWDDHDYFDNDLAGIPEGYTNKDRENVWKVFRYAWNNPSYGFGDEGKGNFYRTRIGAADIIQIDHRYFRTEESFLGEEQMQWLKEQLLDCKGPFIILSNGTMWSDYVSNGKDSWGMYDPEGREKIFSLIEKNNIPGVLLISGDRHGSRGFTIPRESGFSFYEFEVASLGGLGGQPATKPEWTTQFYGLNGGYAFGEFTFNTKLKDPTVTFKLIGEEGDIIHEMTLKRSELTPGNY